MVVGGDAGQRRAGFALAAGADDEQFVVGNVTGVFFGQKGGNIRQVAVFTRRVVDPPCFSA